MKSVVNSVNFGKKDKFFELGGIRPFRGVKTFAAQTATSATPATSVKTLSTEQGGVNSFGVSNNVKNRGTSVFGVFGTGIRCFRPVPPSEHTPAAPAVSAQNLPCPQTSAKTFKFTSGTDFSRSGGVEKFDSSVVAMSAKVSADTDKSGEKPSFGSLNRPVESFSIFTRKGELRVTELNKRNMTFDKLFKTAVLFNRNFNDALGEKELNPTKGATRVANLYKRFFKNDDGNTTLLVARNKKGGIKAAVLSYRSADGESLYVDSIATDRDYRGCGIGKILLDKVIETGEGIFGKVMLFAYKSAYGFYLKDGFSLTPRAGEKSVKLQLEREGRMYGIADYERVAEQTMRFLEKGYKK